MEELQKLTLEEKLKQIEEMKQQRLAQSKLKKVSRHSTSKNVRGYLNSTGEKLDTDELLKAHVKTFIINLVECNEAARFIRKNWDKGLNLVEEAIREELALKSIYYNKDIKKTVLESDFISDKYKEMFIFMGELQPKSGE